jgi:hypothetical protein
MKSGKRKRDDENDADDSSSSEEARVAVKRRKQVHVAWSKEESALLNKLKEKGLSWETISKSFPGRDVRSCQNRYQKHIKEGEKREKRAYLSWSKEHSLLLKKLKEKGLSWEKISKSFPGRDAESCKNRFNNHIKEGEKHVRADWSKEHSLLLKKLKAKGLSWEKLSKSFPGRDAKSCKNRYGIINEGEKRANWSKEQDILLKKLKGKGQSWEKVAKSFPGRTVDSCKQRFHNVKGASNPSKGAARDSQRDSDDSSDDDEDNSSNNEDDNEEDEAASDPSPAPSLDDDILPPVISSAPLTYYPPPLPPRKQRRKFGSSGARRDERMINEFVCHICTRLIFKAQVMRPCGCHVFREECVPPVEARTSACSTCSTPFEQALPYRTGNNIAEEMVRARFVTADVADEWRNRGADYAREQRAERG